MRNFRRKDYGDKRLALMKESRKIEWLWNCLSVCDYLVILLFQVIHEFWWILIWGEFEDWRIFDREPNSPGKQSKQLSFRIKLRGKVWNMKSWIDYQRLGKAVGFFQIILKQFQEIYTENVIISKFKGFPASYVERIKNFPLGRVTRQQICYLPR